MEFAAGDVRGVMPPLVTPFDENEDFDLGAFVQEIAFLRKLPIAGLVVGGSTGEGAQLTPNELAELTMTAVGEAGSLPGHRRCDHNEHT